MEPTLAEEIVKGRVADYAMDVAKLKGLSMPRLAEILREIADKL